MRSTAEQRSFDPAQLRQQADELALRCEHRAAAELYEEILLHDPGDGRVAVKLGDARRQLSELEPAARAYEHAARVFAADGMENMASAAQRLAIAMRAAMRLEQFRRSRHDSAK